ncbi:MAG: hypothetical protein ACFB21_03655 [Opitutales bacterium]
MGKIVLEWQSLCLVKRYFGRIVLADIIASLNRRVSDARFDDIRGIINDFREIEDVDMTRAEYLAAIRFGEVSMQIARYRICAAAFVLPSSPVAERVRPFVDLGTEVGTIFNRRLFEDYTEAERWVWQNANPFRG